MKIGRILFLMSALAFSQAGMANHQASDKNSAADKMWVLDVDKQLEYCHKQVGRALNELRQKDGSYDFSMSRIVEKIMNGELFQKKAKEGKDHE